jgi:hypothetical protein
VDFITEATCMLNVESGTIELSRPQRPPVRFVSWERPDRTPFPTPLSCIDRRQNRTHGTYRQLTKLDLASYKESVAVKEFALNCRPAKRIALRMGG